MAICWRCKHDETFHIVLGQRFCTIFACLCQEFIAVDDSAIDESRNDLADELAFKDRVPVAIANKAIALIDMARVERDYCRKQAEEAKRQASSETKAVLTQARSFVIWAIEAIGQANPSGLAETGRVRRAEMLMKRVLAEIDKEIVIIDRYRDIKKKENR